MATSSHNKTKRATGRTASPLGAASADPARRRLNRYRDLLMAGVEQWNAWRAAHPDERPDLRGVVLADRPGLHGVNFSSCDFGHADLRWTSFANADFGRSNFFMSDLSGSSFAGANFADATFHGTIIAGTSLGDAVGLDSCQHRGPSSIDVQTLFLSRGNLPETFLIGAGVPRPLVDYLPSLVGAVGPIAFYSCFISYATADEEFAKRLHVRLKQEGLPVWFAPKDMRGGQRIVEQLERAIQLHDRLLLVISDSSINSNWVELELRKAFQIESTEGRRKLFPIRLTTIECIKRWRCLDSDVGVDLAQKVREYHIPDFSAWANDAAFESAVKQLLRDLRFDA